MDSPASMANHLETVCLDGPTADLHSDLAKLPYVRCVTDDGNVPSKDKKPQRVVVTTLTEGHRLASDYFLDGQIEFDWKEEQEAETSATKPKGKGKQSEARVAHWGGIGFRENLRTEFGIKEVKKDKTYFIWPDTWWTIYQTIFKYDPNSLIHGVMFAKEQIKISRMLTAHLEAFGAARVGRSGVKFDRLGKTTSGQPIFAVDDETADTIVATFILDLAMLRSYGRDDNGLNTQQKRMLLDLAVWKVKRLLQSPFRFRSNCQLACDGIAWSDDGDTHAVPEKAMGKATDMSVDITSSIKACNLTRQITNVYYPSANLFKVVEESKPKSTADDGSDEPSDDDNTEE